LYENEEREREKKKKKPREDDSGRIWVVWVLIMVEKRRE
jgi:hypothetical protein